MKREKIIKVLNKLENQTRKKKNNKTSLNKSF
jgi:hypothetical protein